ncbi:hypothetical protein [Glycomyces albidus]|uniref:Uncharacterized protein n=1 Tax=Glycomyces albidus TaxID=2656774 RepID=A0A6L5GG38_9ACTN|nr:hypothetical protein [Glycomyces albidus]MQM28525.1 hypothetical protein [Glycomyces albidus]
MIRGGSPRYRTPRPGWEVKPLKELRPPAGPSGRIDLRIGYCADAGPKTIAEQAADLQQRRLAGDPVASMNDLRSSLVPVVLVDGAPVAAGWGRISVPVAAGRHLVEVQSQHSRAWRAVDVTAGAAVKLDYVGMLGDRHRGYGEGPQSGRLGRLTGYTLGPRGRLTYFQYLPANAKYRLSAAVFMLFLLCGVAIMWTSAFTGAPESATFPIAIGVFLLGASLWGGRVLWTWIRFNRGAPEAPLKTPEALLQVPGGPVLAPEILDPAGPVPEPRPGAAVLLVDARFLKDDLSSEELAMQLPPGRERIEPGERRSLDKVGELVPIAHRFAVPPPQIALDGAPVAATWTRMRLEVPPGPHRLTVRTPLPPLAVPRAAEPEERTAAFEVQDGDVTMIGLTVSVHAVPDPVEPLLHRWECRIDGFGPSDRSEAVPAPLADVRGGLRRAWTGRWWETRDDA